MPSSLLHRLLRVLLALSSLLLLSASPALGQAPAERLRQAPAEPLGQRGALRLRLDEEGRNLRGEGRLELRNLSPHHVQRLPLVLYAARFRALDPAINDVVFERYYARYFSAGDLRLDALSSGGVPLRHAEAEQAGLPPGCARWIELPQPLAPGAWIALELAFTLEIPTRLGTFGRDRGRVVLEGGFLPYLPLGDHRGPPARSALSLELVPAPSGEVAEWEGLLGDARVKVATGVVTEWEGYSPTLALGPDLTWVLDEGPQGALPAVRVLAPRGEDPERAQRLASVSRRAARALRDLLPADAAPGRLTFVQAPLRDRFVSPADGSILYSDRLLRVFSLLERFHELEIGRGALLSLVRQQLAARELGPDRDWICEALSWELARRWAQTRAGLKGDQIRAGLQALDFIPAFDQLLRAPRFPGSDLFYGRFNEPWDAVPDELARALSRRARGRVVLEKLRDCLGEEALEAWVQDALTGSTTPRRAAEERAGASLDDFFALWLSGDGLTAPSEDLSLDLVEVLAEHPDGTRDLRLRIQRSGDPRIGAVGEPVEVGGVDAEGAPTRARWEGRGDLGEVVLRHGGGWFDPIRLDPEGRILQSNSAPDHIPSIPLKLLVNRFRVKPDLNRGNRNEAAVGITLVPGYDYAQRIALDAFYEEDERGVHLGYGYGFGWAIDQRRFGLGVGLDTTVAQLTQGVLRSGTNLAESEGDLVSYGAGLSFDTRPSRLDPSTGAALGFHYEFADRHFGTDFRFHKFDGRLTLIYSPIRGTTFGGELLLGQAVGSDVPTQRLYDAGGEDAVRGVRTSRFIGRAQIALRGELRQTLWTDLDLSNFSIFYVRRIQAVVFLDAGDVGEDLDHVFRARDDWKWGTGAGVRVWGDLFGVTRLVLRFDVGFRIDDTNDLGPQYYLGLGQSF